MAKVILTAGLGFGDEGKGSVVDYLARAEDADLVIRFNGGAQAAHNVVLPDGTHHTFSQFGSGMFNGAQTYLSRHMLVNPLTMENEARALETLGCNHPYTYMIIDRDALVTSIYQVAANRLREIIRDKNRHGSCGMGIGETVQDSLDHPGMAIRVGDLLDRYALSKKLRFSRDLKTAEFKDCGVSDSDREMQILFERPDYFANRYLDFGRKITTVDHHYLPHKLKRRETGAVIFEGAQGVLLDQDHGFFPYVTRSKTTFENAFDLLGDYDGPIRKIGVFRGYMTRHGAGPFPTEIDTNEITPDTHNTYGTYQEGFRLGYFDMVLARYALQVIGGVDELVLTNLDKLGDKPKLCMHYLENGAITTHLPVQTPLDYFGCVKEENPKIDLAVQERLTQRLLKVTAALERVTNLPEPRAGIGLIARISEELRTRVSLCSTGPTHQDKHRFSVVPASAYRRVQKSR